MARNRTVNYAVVDIKLLREGTTVETYVELFEELRKNPRQIPLERNNYLKFRFIKPLNEENLLNGFSGEVFKSNGITSDWYDEEKNERNRHKNVEENYIPSNLKANPRFFKFIFFPLHQKLVCEVKDPENEIQIGLLEKFLKKLIITDKLQDKFGRIIVSTVPEVISAEKIINSKTLKRIHICIEKLEIGEQFDSAHKVISHMVDMNTESYIQTYIAGKNDFLNLSDEVKELIKFAAEHGIIEYKIENQEGLIEDKSTAESNPLIIRVQYDPDETDQHYLIQAKALEIVSNIN
ncbi:DUF4747 family protein [Acinetobacter johnsonii]|uniref:DUF4747 family protein n=1 Tax=Acinetobacter johnsonii TaxID=40214 RepID=A0AA42MCP2_ACIJO|nr:DUF4747 family protein [Acinetobacter johnsonii]MDH0827537.1 DUF4747 family protein [Acinetobacter johnsonii]